MLQDFPPENLTNIINHSDSKILFTSDYIWTKLNAEELPNIESAISLENFECIFAKDKKSEEYIANAQNAFNEKYPNGYTKDDIKYAEVPNSNLVCLSYTSGTTGFSKGVMLTANNFAGNITFGITTKMVHKKKVLSFLPLAHAYCCAFDFLTSFCDGTHTTYLGKMPAAPLLMKALSDIKPDIIFTVPLIIEKVYKKKLQPIINKPYMKVLMSLPFIKKVIGVKIHYQLKNAFGGKFEQMVIGGAPLNPEVEAFLRKIRIPYTVGYGMTECAPLISYSHWKEYKETSVGKILPTMEVKIMSNDPYKEIGEILVRGENVMAGYYKNEEATNAALDADGWLHTGDMGYIDTDNNIYIRGRNKSMLLGANGQNIYPEEIEAKLNNMPYVAESVVVQNKAAKLIALVYPDKDAMKADKISEKALARIMDKNKRHLNKQIAAYEQVTEIRIHATEFEKTAKKSIKRFLYSVDD
ncbi:MAG: AMP-binding protein, partial [Paludibacteraceae bacterium]|nr:AMP-binding protein [Paludibacteraceae bacterium]